MAMVSLAQQATISSGTACFSSFSSSFYATQKNSFFLPPDSATSRRNLKHSGVMATPECSSSSGMTDSQGGRILRQVLNKEGRAKLNLTSDRGFYSSPRLVTHVDDQFLSTLTNLYRERIPDNAEVLDLMSSWVSHLPAEKKYKRVVGHGLNAQELSRNRQLDHFFVKDLNAEPKIENADGSFDAVVCTVSVQYLEQPEKVFAEIYRVLRPGGVCIVSFSNRMFYEKAVAAWRDGSDYSRTQLVKQYFQCIDGFTVPEVVKKLPDAKSSQNTSPNPFSFITNLFASAGRDPFYAVVAYRNFKPIRE
ncbi:hypothetical protein KC19_4G066300 [Ceratodon purpureus]|uniref:Methyltransferase type 11 domain-containing protein n=1 Tax=Ceratodon purpureus TaxID=3225 RepID=A0A8T0I7I6_CERPU|nr:hypothetical protein KC19_4G066300 [Ceratodon purpureus]KAG0579017.1 hypothetical protein KC19_4G066300 [Ceratodon purpureus]KAG0579018.1 hypothetical protein KC19_4G066300 [Ceratodon purpureus]